MRKYIKPELDIVEFDNLDVIMVSEATEDSSAENSIVLQNGGNQLVNSASTDDSTTADNTAPTTAPEAATADTPLTAEEPAAEPTEETPAEEPPAATDEADASGDIVE